MNVEALIRDANPVQTSDLPLGDSPHARHTLDRILGEPATSRWASGRWHRLALAGVAAAGVAALVLAGTLQPWSSQPEPRVQPAPATVRKLHALAVLAAAQPMPRPPAPGQFQYTESESLEAPLNYDGGQYFTVQYRVRSQTWIASNGSGRSVQTFSDPTFPTAHDRASWVRAGRPSLVLPPAHDSFGPGGFPYGVTHLAELPTSPEKLAALISSRRIEGGTAGPAEDFAQVGDLLRETYAPPALRSALFQVAAHIPGVKILGTVTDTAGRTGVGVAYVSAPRPGQRSLSELVFDPATAALLAEQTVTVNTETRVSTLTGWTDYLKSGVADSASSIPASMATP